MAFRPKSGSTSRSRRRSAARPSRARPRRRSDCARRSAVGDGGGRGRSRGARIVASVSRERLERTVRALAGFGTRHTLSDANDAAGGIGAARNWIRARLDQCSREGVGRLSPSSFDAFLQPAAGRLPQPVEIVNATAPYWQGAQHVGNVTRATVPLSKDDYVFSMRAVDAAGHRSLVSYPLSLRTPSLLQPK